MLKLPVIKCLVCHDNALISVGLQQGCTSATSPLSDSVRALYSTQVRSYQRDFNGMALAVFMFLYQFVFSLNVQPFLIFIWIHIFYHEVSTSTFFLNTVGLDAFGCLPPLRYCLQWGCRGREEHKSSSVTLLCSALYMKAMGVIFRRSGLMPSVKIHKPL